MNYTGQANEPILCYLNQTILTSLLLDKYAKMNRYDCVWLASYVIFNLHACINKESPL